MFNRLRARLKATRRGSPPRPGPQTAPLTTYRLVGYATPADGRRLRVYIDAAATVTVFTAVLIQAAPGRFDYAGQPLGLQPAPEDLARQVRARLLRFPTYFDSQDTSFQAVT